MCDIAPFQMKCENEGCKDKFSSCAVYHLNQAFNEMLLQLPIINQIVVPYRCPDFEIKRK